MNDYFLEMCVFIKWKNIVEFYHYIKYYVKGSANLSSMSYFVGWVNISEEFLYGNVNAKLFMVTFIMILFLFKGEKQFSHVCRENSENFVEVCGNE